MATRNQYRKQSGQAMVEIALSIPFLLLCLVAIIYFGRAYYITETLTFAAQEGAKVAARLPDLSDPDQRGHVQTFVKNILGDANLLSNGRTGDIPSGAAIKVLPWEATEPEDTTPAGTVTVVVKYPFSLLINPFTGQAAGETTQVSIAMDAEGNNPVQFADFSIRQSATVSPQLYQRF